MFMKKKSLFIISTLIVYIIYIFIKYISFNQAVLNIINYNILAFLLILFSILFYIIPFVYLLFIIKNYNNITWSFLKTNSLFFFILGIFDFLPFLDFRNYIQNSSYFVCVVIILIINTIVYIKKFFIDKSFN